MYVSPIETSTLTRKERVVAERHNLFLTIARQMMHDEGFHQLSMDRVADAAEYSKGTIYQHFPNKEEILIQLCNRSMHTLQAFGKRAVDYPGNHRERCLAFQFAHDLWQRLEPQDVCMMDNLQTDGLMDKVSEKSREIHNQLEFAILGQVTSIVQDAKDARDLPNSSLNAQEVVFGLWSLCHGGQILRSYDLPLDTFGIRDPGRSIAVTAQAALNGFGWQPLMNEQQTDELLKKFRDDYFRAEYVTIGALNTQEKTKQEQNILSDDSQSAAVPVEVTTEEVI